MIAYTEVEGFRVDTRIFTRKFACDYLKCKGACCNAALPGIPLNGGDLLTDEAVEILYHRRAISFLCEEKEDQRIVFDTPLYKHNGIYYTVLRGDKCCFCNMRKGTCVLKTARALNVADVDIPLSCQLYPIIWDTYDDYDSLTVGDVFDEYCKCGYDKGSAEGVYMLDFLREPLIRGFGEEFFLKLKEVQKDFI